MTPSPYRQRINSRVDVLVYWVKDIFFFINFQLSVYFYNEDLFLVDILCFSNKMSSPVDFISMRASKDLYIQRSCLPWVDYERPTTTSSHSFSSSQDPARELRAPQTKPSRWRSLKEGYGSRHIFDDAHFSLWVEEQKNFRRHTKEEAKWIGERYRAHEIFFFYPFLFIVTDNPPDPLPLTVACVATRFLPSAPLALLPGFYTNYANPRLHDPAPLRLARWAHPTKLEITEIIRALSTIVNLRAVNWFGYYCYVELCVDDKSYDRHSLPEIVAGKATMYHHSQASFWKDVENHALSRLVDPAAYTDRVVHDDTNYLREGAGTLQPGVRIANDPKSNDGFFSEAERGTTCGVRLQKQGHAVVTVANHGVADSEDVYHPSALNGDKIGRVVERWPTQDVALVELTPSVKLLSGYGTKKTSSIQ